MTKDSEPRTKAGRQLLESIAPGRTDGWLAGDIIAIEAEAYDAAMADAFDDVQRIDRAEAAQGAASRAELDAQAVDLLDACFERNIYSRGDLAARLAEGADND